MKINEVATFVACRFAMAEGQLMLVSRTDGNITVQRIDGVCPKHDSAACLDVYVARRHLAGWSLRQFWSWRRLVRCALGAALKQKSGEYPTTKEN